MGSYEEGMDVEMEIQEYEDYLVEDNIKAGYGVMPAQTYMTTRFVHYITTDLALLGEMRLEM